MKRMMLTLLVVVSALIVYSVVLADDHDNAALVIEGDAWAIYGGPSGFTLENPWWTTDTKIVSNHGGNVMLTIHWSGISYEQQRYNAMNNCQQVAEYYGIPQFNWGIMHYSDEGITLKCQ